MGLNMELGVLVRGGELPGRVQGHFGKLVAVRILVGVG